MASALHLVVRAVHVLAMAVLLGGAAAVWAACRDSHEGSLLLARRYEWAFWGGLGLLVVTGVGNLGALGAPAPSTRWGRLLTVKLVVVLGLVVASFLRTQLVIGAGTGDDRPAVDPATLSRLYAGTAGWLLAVVALAEVLAHG